MRVVSYCLILGVFFAAPAQGGQPSDIFRCFFKKMADVISEISGRRTISLERLEAEKKRLAIMKPAQFREALLKGTQETSLAYVELIAARTDTDALLPLKPESLKPSESRMIHQMIRRMERSKHGIRESDEAALLETLYVLTHRNPSKIQAWRENNLPTKDTEQWLRKKVEIDLLTTEWSELLQQEGRRRQRDFVDRISEFYRASGISDVIGILTVRNFFRALKLSGPDMLKWKKSSPKLLELCKTKGWDAAEELARKEYGKLPAFENAWRLARLCYLSYAGKVMVGGLIQNLPEFVETGKEVSELPGKIKDAQEDEKKRQDDLQEYLRKHPQEANIYNWAVNKNEFDGQYPDPNDPAILEEYRSIKKNVGLSIGTEETEKKELCALYRRFDFSPLPTVCDQLK